MKNFQTSDLALAAFIECHDQACSIELIRPGKAIFIFSHNEKIDELIQAFWSGSSLVEPKNFFSQLKFLKTRLYEIQ